MEVLMESRNGELSSQESLPSDGKQGESNSTKRPRADDSKEDAKRARHSDDANATPRAVQESALTTNQEESSIPGKASAIEDSNEADIPDKGRESVASTPFSKEPVDDSADASGKEVLKNEVVSQYVNLPSLPSRLPSLDPLNEEELTELERLLEIQQGDETWKDWGGNLAFIHKEVYKPRQRNQSNSRSTFKQPLKKWAENLSDGSRCLRDLIRYVYNQDGTPDMAKRILAHGFLGSVEDMLAAVQRVSYDPTVLQQDGWTTAKSKEPVGATGGPHLIGESILWDGYKAVVIAYVYDAEIGDLWKALWDDSEDTFDLEAEEVLEAKRKWERKQKQNKSSEPSRRSARAVASDFTVEGIEHGIIQAQSFCRGARPGVFWPARVLHASEYEPAPSSKGRRAISKQKVQVVFLAPYWSSQSFSTGNRRGVALAEGVSRHGESLFCSGPLFEMETLDASDEVIEKYPFVTRTGLDVEELRTLFRLTGLPRAAFSRFVDAHRLALAIAVFSRKELKSTESDMNSASAGLFDTHALAVKTPLLPPALLHLPFGHILSQLPSVEEISSSIDDEGKKIEPALQLSVIMESMKPPACWGKVEETKEPAGRKPDQAVVLPLVPVSDGSDENPPNGLERFLGDLPQMKALIVGVGTSSPVANILKSFEHLIHFVDPASLVAKRDGTANGNRREVTRSLIISWALAKSHGEDAICSVLAGGTRTVLVEWRRLCERIYKHITRSVSTSCFGNGVSLVLTDVRCNEHLTSRGCPERPVRLPAALKGARNAGAGSDHGIQLETSIEDCYLDVAEKIVLRRAHSAAYLKKMKRRCSAISPGTEVAPLTEDSDGNGGDDTMGSRGTWMAAIASVGAVVKAVDMIVGGECVNSFCITRPPGHHAGRDLHPMKAVSNGFCILNTAACAALYATTPASEGGPGLRRVCVIDIDVHHGNGTQDILCSTYDPRFLYVSLHAGGSDVNGSEADDELATEMRSPGAKSGREGIYPGRCGDTSPHKGVLNIPLGPKVTSHGVGHALVSKVAPCVNEFSPDLIVLSTGFDAHVNDPLGLGGLTAENFGAVTESLCRLAFESCSGRLLSVLEGGYGVPCCRVQERFDAPSPQSTTDAPSTPPSAKQNSQFDNQRSVPTVLFGTVDSVAKASQPSKLLELGKDLPADMDDQVPLALQKRLEKCHAEGFVECVQEHVKALSNCNKRK